MKHVAEGNEAARRLMEAMRQEGVDLLFQGKWDLSSDLYVNAYAERSRLLQVLGFQRPDHEATRQIQRYLQWTPSIAQLQPADGRPLVIFVSLREVAERLGDFSQHPAMQEWTAAQKQREREQAALIHHKSEAERARKRRLAPPAKKPLPFSVDALAETLGFYDFGEGGRRQPNDRGPVDRWFMNEDGLSLYVRNGEILLEDWRHDLSDEEEDIPISDPRWYEVNIRQITFPIPQTAGEALSQLIRAGLWDDTSEEREDFLLAYREALQVQPSHVARQGRQTSREPTL